MSSSNIIPFRSTSPAQTGLRTDISGADSILFVCSSDVLNSAAFRRLETICAEATRLPHLLIRLEEGGASLYDALDALRSAAGRRIRVQPIGLPLTDTLRSWLRGVAREWSSWTENHDAEILFGPGPRAGRSGDGIPAAPGFVAAGQPG
ncbi:hypothetical protein [Tropicimonas marinistellae]|uniref:hypothetical protein n=1 Tax=Tropicimonas marinistellae TaxID=1739787 RepID=UPI000830CF37|nr:hypothetical protein [Tropicimonas marinistellae]